MPIIFTVNEPLNYFTSKWVGKITDSEMLDSYKIFIHGSSFRPGMSEFADISEMDFSQVTSNGLSHLANYVKDFLDSNGVQAMKVAAYSPHDLQFGMARAYDAWTFESPELVQVFKDSDMALAWLNKES